MTTPSTVAELYQSILGRAPDAAGQAYWQSQFGDTIDPTELATFTQAAQPELATTGYKAPVTTPDATTPITPASTTTPSYIDINTAMNDILSGKSTADQAFASIDPKSLSSTGTINYNNLGMANPTYQVLGQTMGGDLNSQSSSALQSAGIDPTSTLSNLNTAVTNYQSKQSLISGAIDSAYNQIAKSSDPATINNLINQIKTLTTAYQTNATNAPTVEKYFTNLTGTSQSNLNNGTDGLMGLIGSHTDISALDKNIATGGLGSALNRPVGVMGQEANAAGVNVGYATPGISMDPNSYAGSNQNSYNYIMQQYKNNNDSGMFDLIGNVFKGVVLGAMTGGLASAIDGTAMMGNVASALTDIGVPSSIVPTLTNGLIKTAIGTVVNGGDVGSALTGSAISGASGLVGTDVANATGSPVLGGLSKGITSGVLAGGDVGNILTGMGTSAISGLAGSTTKDLTNSGIVGGLASAGTGATIKNILSPDAPTYKPMNISLNSLPAQTVDVSTLKPITTLPFKV